MTRRRKTVKRFPLLLYRAVARRWRGAAFWLMPAGAALWYALRYGDPPAPELSWCGAVVGGIGALLWLYTHLLRRAAVLCTPKGILVRTPLYTMGISYRRVETVRPTTFASLYPAHAEKAARRRLYEGIWGKTAIVVDLKSTPLSPRLMRLWLPRYLFLPEGRGLVFVVEDWMGLSRCLDTYRNAYLMRRSRRY